MGPNAVSDVSGLSQGATVNHSERIRNVDAAFFFIFLKFVVYYQNKNGGENLTLRGIL